AGLRNPLRRREAVPSSCPPPSQHVSPAGGAHSDAEPVYFAPMAPAWLESPLHLAVPPLSHPVELPAPERTGPAVPLTISQDRGVLQRAGPYRASRSQAPAELNPLIRSPFTTCG